MKSVKVKKNISILIIKYFLHIQFYENGQTLSNHGVV